MSNFEYSCSTANKFSFLNESEDVEDPSEILANLQAQQAKEATAAKDAAKKDAKTGEKKVTKLSQTGPGALKKDQKKVPLQQQPDNSKQGGDKNKSKSGGGDRKPGQDNRNKSGKEPRALDKENTNKERRQRPEGGFENRGEGGGFRNNGPRGDKPFRPRPVRREGEEGQQGNEGGFGGGDNEFRRGGGGSGGGFRGPRPQGDRQQQGGDRQQGDRPAGRGGFRGQRRGAPQDAEHVREFDRHSGSDKTGIKAVDKKDGAGKSNWGTYNDELAVEGEAASELNAEQKNADWAARVDENEENKIEGEGEDKEVAPNFMTLEEYKALKNEIKKKNDFNIRRPGEGEDPSKWNNTYVLPKKPVEEDEEEDDEEDEEEELDEEEIKKKQLLNQIQIKFYEQPSQRDRGDRRERGDDRGDRRRPVGGPRQSAAEPSSSAVNVEGGASGVANESSPEKQPRRDNRPPRQQGGGNNNNRGQKGGQRGGNFRQKEKPITFDDSEFPSLGGK